MLGDGQTGPAPTPTSWIPGALGSPPGRRAGLGVVALGLAVGLPHVAHAVGPWRAQVVDAETGEPVEGVAVVAVWERRKTGDMELGVGRTGFSAAAEAETDAAGRFVIPARLFLQPPLAYGISGPELVLFKAGYGGWQVRGAETNLTRPGVVLEIEPLPTRAARVAYLQGRASHGDAARQGWHDAERPGDPAAPYERIARYEQAVNAARAAVGLGPVGLRVPGLWYLDQPRDPGSGRGRPRVWS